MGNPMYGECGWRNCPHHPMGTANCNGACPHHGEARVRTTATVWVSAPVAVSVADAQCEVRMFPNAEAATDA
jgi:hypothetical protein